MSEIKQHFETAIEMYGLKKVLAEILKIAKIVDKDTVGQFIIHFNNGGITDTYLNKKIVG